MPYDRTSELPDGVKKLPQGGQEIYMAAFNSAFKQYNGDEPKSHATAWTAVETKYKKNTEGEWVAKESVESLRLKYTEIIQEAGKRNASSDATRIKKIMELCQELLSSEPAEESITEAIKECDDCLGWLREQAAMKTEDGVEYPASAFAYVPDTEKPSEWKLRLWEDSTKKVTRRQLGAAAAALSPGGFRGQKVNIPAADLPGVKRRIRAAYRSLDVPDEEIPRWVKEAEVRDYINESITVPVAEVTAEAIAKGILPVRIIQPGFNTSKTRHYSESAVRDSVKIFEGVKQFANHATKSEEKERPERDIRDWVATLENVRIAPNGNAVGEAHIHAGWFKEMAQGLFEAGTLNKLGVSINSVGKGSKQKIDGVETFAVEGLVDHPLKSVDFVTEAGAGGQAGVQESITSSVVDAYLIDLTTLKEARPDLIREVEAEIKAKNMQEVKAKMEIEEQVKELTTANETLTKERDELQGKLDEANKAKAKAEAQAIIKEAVSKAELPDAAKTKLLEKFADAETDTGVAEAIAGEVKYIAEVTEAGKIRGMGPAHADPEADKKALAESFKKLGMSDEQAKEAANVR